MLDSGGSLWVRRDLLAGCCVWKEKISLVSNWWLCAILCHRRWKWIELWTLLSRAVAYRTAWTDFFALWNAQSEKNEWKSTRRWWQSEKRKWWRRWKRERKKSERKFKRCRNMRNFHHLCKRLICNSTVLLLLLTRGKKSVKNVIK